MQNTTERQKELGFDLVTEDEASEMLGLAKSTLQQRRWLKRPPAYVKVGRFVRYRKRDLAAFLEKCTVKPAKC